MKKGFTLIELLAVVVMIGIISAIVVPSLFNITQKSRTNAYNTLVGVIENSTNLYVSRHRDEVVASIDQNGCYVITLQQLINEGLIKKPINDPRTNEEVPLTKEIYVNRDSDNVIVSTFNSSVNCDIPVAGVDGLTVKFVTNGNSILAKSRSTVVFVSGNNIDKNSLRYQWTTSIISPNESSFNNTFNNGNNITSPNNVAGGYYLWILAKDTEGNTTIVRSNVFNLDSTPPVITMLGNNPVIISQGDTYNDAGINVGDDLDGPITNICTGDNTIFCISSTGTVNPNVIGKYTITYNASDSLGNSSVPLIRTVNVISPEYIASKGVNKPKLASGMIPVKWNGSKWVSISNSDTDTSWYNYTNKEWANAVNLDKTKTIDYSGNEYVGTITGATQTATGMSFDGVDDNILASSSLNNYNFGSTMSMAVRFKLLSFNAIGECIFGNWQSGGGGIFVGADNKIGVSLYIGGSYRTVTSTTAIQLNTFYTAAFTYNGTTINLYVNGQLAGSLSVSGTVGVSPVSFAVGANPNLDGAIQEMANAVISDAVVYKSVLTPTEISNNYASNVNVITTNLLLGYKFVEGIANNTAISIGNISTMWVWIPRYIYNISSGWHTNTAGTIDIQFSMGTDDTRADTVTLDRAGTANSSNNRWTNHPAFTFGTTELTGMWVAKFEMSGTTASLDSKPGITSLRSVTVGAMFPAIRNMETNNKYGWALASGLNADGTFTNNTNNVDSHMIKNTEWGAVAYLSQSIYGKNFEITKNDNSSSYTGGGTGTAYTTNVGQSTTGTIHGIYDISGGAFENVMANINNTAGYSGLTPSIINDKYIDRYTTYGNTKYGDAVYETSASMNGSTSWYGDYSDIPTASNPWFLRGGCWANNSGVGAFSFAYGDGNSASNVGFRAVLAVATGL